MIAGKYGGGVFCNLPDGTVCMCSQEALAAKMQLNGHSLTQKAISRIETGVRVVPDYEVPLVIAGKYGGGVFCNLPDGTVCMCNYSYQHEDSEFQSGDHVTLVVKDRTDHQ